MKSDVYSSQSMSEESEDLLQDLIFKANIILDELQDVMSRIYQVKNANSSYEMNDDNCQSETSYWWDDSAIYNSDHSISSCSHDDSLPLSCDSYDENNEVKLSDHSDIFSCYSCEPAEDHFITSMSEVISRLAPTSRYNARRAKQKRRRKMLKKVHPELRSIWSHVSVLVSPVIKETPPEPMPTVDWSKVNKRFLTNIPSPAPIPVQGCSEDESFYTPHTYITGGQAYNSKFEAPNPFSTLPGYRTVCGVVNVPSQAFHGYVWGLGGGLWLDVGRRLRQAQG